MSDCIPMVHFLIVAYVLLNGLSFTGHLGYSWKVLVLFLLFLLTHVAMCLCDLRRENVLASIHSPMIMKARKG